MVVLFLLDPAQARALARTSSKTFSQRTAVPLTAEAWRNITISNLAQPPSRCDRKNKIANRLSDIQNLTSLVVPRPDGRLVKAPEPTGWSASPGRWDYFTNQTTNVLLRNLKARNKSLMSLKNRYYKKGAHPDKPELAPVLPKFIGPLVATVASDLARHCAALRQPVTVHAAKYAWRNALAVLRLEDDRFTTNWRAAWRQAQVHLRVPSAESAIDLFNRLQRRHAILEDVVVRMSVRLQRRHFFEPPFALFGLGDTTTLSKITRKGITVATYNCSTIKGVHHSDEPIRLLETLKVAEEHGVHVVALQETRLVDKELPKAVPRGWTVLAQGRKAAGNRNPGGGVALALRLPKGHPNRQLELPTGKHIEMIGVEIGTRTGSTSVISVYWPPGGTAAKDKADTDLIKEISTARAALGQQIIWLGDLNARIVSNVHAVADRRGQQLQQTAHVLNLTPRNTKEATHLSKSAPQQPPRAPRPTGSAADGAASALAQGPPGAPPGSLIDYVFASAALKSVATRVVPVDSRVGHQMVIVQFPDVQRVEQRTLKRIRLDAVRLMEPQVLERYQVEVERCFGTRDLVTLGDYTDEIVRIANEVVGIRQPKKSGDASMPAWWTDELSLLLARKKQLLNMASLNATLEDELRELSTRISHLMRVRSREHHQRFDDALSSDIRKSRGITRDSARVFRGLLTGQRATPTAQPPPAENKKFWSDIFAAKDLPGEKEQLDAWCADATNFRPPTDQRAQELLKPFTPDELIRAASSLPKHKAADEQGMSNEFISALPPAALATLAPHFTALLVEGELYPANWTRGLTVLLFKAGDSLLPKNYRPITLLNTFYKFFEVCLNRRWSHYLEVTGSINPLQFGFRPNRSCEQMLVTCRLAIEEGLANSIPVVAITFDAAKAFDTVSHPVLFMKKMRDRGDPPQLIRCLARLFDRHINLLPDGSEINVGRSVPQGGITSPRGFQVYNDDLPDSVWQFATKRLMCLEIAGKLTAKEKKMFKEHGLGPLPRFTPLFADDTNALCWYNLHLVQAIVDGIRKWFADNRMTIQLPKTEAAVFSRKPLKAAEKFHLMIGDQKVNWSDGVSIVGARFNVADMVKGVAQLPAPTDARVTAKKLTAFLKNSTADAGVLIETTFVRSQVFYGSAALSVDKSAEMLQNEIASMILGTYRNTSTDRKNLVLGLLPVSALVAKNRINTAMSMIFFMPRWAERLIGTSIAEARPWGTLLAADLDAYGLRPLWQATIGLPVASRTPRAFSAFKYQVKAAIQRLELDRQRLGTFTSVTTLAEVEPWTGMHPMLRVGKGKKQTAYMLLRNNLSAPHLVHGKHATPPICPCCHHGPDTAAHLLRCPHFGAAATDVPLDLTPQRYNLREPEQFEPILISLNKRWLARRAKETTAQIMAS